MDACDVAETVESTQPVMQESHLENLNQQPNINALRTPAYHYRQNQYLA